MLFRTLLLACLATAEALTVAKIWKEYVADRIAGRNDTEASRANASLSIARHHGARRLCRICGVQVSGQSITMSNVNALL